MQLLGSWQRGERLITFIADLQNTATLRLIDAGNGDADRRVNSLAVATATPLYERRSNYSLSLSDQHR